MEECFTFDEKHISRQGAHVDLLNCCKSSSVSQSRSCDTNFSIKADWITQERGAAPPPPAAALRRITATQFKQGISHLLCLQTDARSQCVCTSSKMISSHKKTLPINYCGVSISIFYQYLCMQADNLPFHGKTHSHVNLPQQGDMQPQS